MGRRSQPGRANERCTDFATGARHYCGGSIRIGAGSSGNATGTLQFSRPQFEVGASRSSFIPTTTAAVTRQPDVLTASSISWYRQDEGAVVFEGIASAITGANQGLFVFSNGGTTERLFSRYSTAGNPSLLVISGGSTQATIATTVSPAGSVFRHAASYKVNDFNAATNGTLGTTDTSGAVPTVASLAFGIERQDTGGSPFMGYARRFQYFNTRLPNAQIQGMSRV